MPKTKDEQLVLDKFSSLPDRFKEQVLDFMDFLLKEKVEKPTPKKAKFGSHKGLFIISDDFDEPLEDFKDYMP